MPSLGRTLALAALFTALFVVVLALAGEDREAALDTCTASRDVCEYTLR